MFGLNEEVCKAVATCPGTPGDKVFALLYLGEMAKGLAACSDDQITAALNALAFPVSDRIQKW